MGVPDEIDPAPEDVADRVDWEVALDLLTTMEHDIVELRADTARVVAALQAENWRLVQAAARDAPPQTWRPLKGAAAVVSEPYQNVRFWCVTGAIVAERRGARWFIEMASLEAHVAAKRGIAGR
jgi:hypothetical protein